jgi:hypothetical protein
MKAVIHSVLGAILVLTNNVANAEIVEIEKMSAVLPLVKGKTLVVFDLDNTIIEPTQTLGSDQWFGYLVDKFTKLGETPEQATDHAIEDWSEVQHASDVVPVEGSTPRLVERLQRRGDVDVMALTARPYEMRHRTRIQLRAVGVDFEKDAPFSENKDLPSDLNYHRGIVSIGPKQSKGEAITRILAAISQRYDRVLFIDDKAKHTKSVDEALAQSDLENFSFRYGAADPKVQGFNAKVADKQFDVFQRTGVIISDFEASK